MDVPVTDLQSTLDAKHCHGIDCCWECFHGRPTHPVDADDYACAWELSEYSEAAVGQGCRPGGQDGS